jgi:hypothetical protein
MTKIWIVLNILCGDLMCYTCTFCPSNDIPYYCKQDTSEATQAAEFWWFSIVIQKKLDASVFMKVVAAMKENIQDDSLYKFLGQMFDADVLNVEFGGFPKGQGCLQEGIWMKYLLPFQALMNLPLKLEI